MNRKITALLTVMAFSINVIQCLAQENKAAPATRTDNVMETLHGVRIADPYRWLEDQESPETRAWIKTQNEHTESILGALPIRGKIRERLTQLLKIDTISTPFARGGRYFLSKRRADQNQSVIYVRNWLAGKDEILLDPNTMSADHSTSIQMQDVSADGKLLVYGVRQGGEDEHNIKLLDVDARKDLPDQLPKGRISVSLRPDKTGWNARIQTECF